MIKGMGDHLTWTDNWSENFKSWKFFSPLNKYLLIKYEDLIQKREETFLKILKFIYKLSHSSFSLDKQKFENVIKTTSFENMQKLEKSFGFAEANLDKKTGKKIPFFYLGPKNNWKNILENSSIKKIEKEFEKEMIELGYL